jgi:flagellar biosynthesis/type III secretory pathway protein FliH
MQETNLKTMTEAAISRLPWARRRIAQRVMARNPDAFLELVAAKLAESPDADELHATINSETFDGMTMMEIDWEKLEKWIELILKFLPLIIAFI